MYICNFNSNMLEPLKVDSLVSFLGLAISFFFDSHPFIHTWQMVSLYYAYAARPRRQRHAYSLLKICKNRYQKHHSYILNNRFIMSAFSLIIFTFMCCIVFTFNTQECFFYLVTGILYSLTVLMNIMQAWCRCQVQIRPFAVLMSPSCVN